MCTRFYLRALLLLILRCNDAVDFGMRFIVVVYFFVPPFPARICGLGFGGFRLGSMGASAYKVRIRASNRVTSRGLGRICKGPNLHESVE